MKFTDNPVVGGGAPSGSASAGGGGIGVGGREAAFSIGKGRSAIPAGDGDKDPLSGDSFLKGFFGR